MARGARSKKKTEVILDLKKEYPKEKIFVWLKIAELPKSSFYEWKKKIENFVDKDLEIKLKIKDIVSKNKLRYGYRRVCNKLKEQGLVVNHKKVLRIMKELNLLCKKFRNKSRKYSSYKGEVGKIAGNLINRNFYANKPNKIWLTDVTEFRLSGREEKLYLSPILDIFNGEIISYSISKNPTTDFTNESLDNALDKFGILNGLVIHSDQGLHYQHKSWCKRLEKRGIKQSMSRKGNCLDNSPMENFFGLLKQEMFYGEDFESYQHLKFEIEEYIRWYNEERIKEKLNGLSPIEYRLQSA